MDLKFEKIVEKIKSDIARGILREGARLPTYNEMEKTFKVSRITVIRAVEELRTAGLVYSEAGRKGYFVSKEAVGEFSPSKRSYRIGLLLHIRSDRGRESPFISGLIALFKDICGERNYDMVFQFHTSPLQLDAKQFELIYRSMNVDGLLVGGNVLDDSCLRHIASSKLNVVLFGTFFPYAPIPCVIAGYNAPCVAVEHLYGTGKRRIAFISNIQSERMGHESIFMYQKKCRELGLDHSLNKVRDMPAGDVELVGQLKELLKENIDALIVMDDLKALYAMQYFIKQGLDVPGDIAVMGCGGAEFTQYTNPPLSTVEMPLEESCRLATGMLMAMINKRPPDMSSVTLPVRLIARGSTCPGQA